MWNVLVAIFSILLFLDNVQVHADSLVPCYFISGDSLSDAGNNNGLSTKAKTNYKPYGIDYPAAEPTGRFTNGRTSVDVIAEHLGFKENIAPYSTANGDQILNGVNYASGAGGIRPKTGSHLGGRISLEAQLWNHQNIIAKLNSTLNDTTSEYLSKCLYTVNIGSNDYINNYFMPKIYSSRRQYRPNRYATDLVNEYSRQLKILYENGARKIAVFGLGPVGCTLAEVDKFLISFPCVGKINKAVGMFNKRLKKLVPQLNRQLSDATFTYINTPAIIVGPLEAALLGIEGFIQPFATASGSESLKGVNYASGAGGLRPESGAQLGQRTSFSGQVLNHGTTIMKLQPFVIGQPVSQYLKTCLYTVNIGSNDYINNYFMPQFYPSKNIFNPDQYATALVTEYGQQLKALYLYGARKTAIFGLGQIGCTPAEIQRRKATQCVEEINKAVTLFNQKLLQLVDYLNTNLPGAKLTFIDTIALQSASPSPQGFNVSGTCCKVRSDFQCEENVRPCPDRTQYAFYDGYHPTEVLNVVTAQAAFNSPNSLSAVHPVDIDTLVSS